MAPLLDLFVRWLRPVTLALLLVVVPAAAPLPAYGKVVAVATTGMIADAVRAVGGELVEVHGLMGPGVDPHLYKASQGDVRRMAAADVIFYNGLMLEGRLSDLLARMARQKPTVAVSEYVPQERLIEAAQFEGHYDPHIWFDLSLWKLAVERIRDGLIEVDPVNQQAYQQNAAAYMQELDRLDGYIRERLAEIPPAQRVLVTAHDAFGYFGLAYGIEVVGLQGISTDSEVGLRDIQNLVAFLVERGIKAVFVESSVPRRSLEAVVQGAAGRGHQVVIGGELYSDALGEPGTPAGSFVGMIRHNVDTIVAALK